jgi:hypothetical protein
LANSFTLYVLCARHALTDARIARNGVCTIIAEMANRVARDLMVQEAGFAMLRDPGVTLNAADSPSSCLDDGPSPKLIRQIRGAVSEFDMAMIVAKPKGFGDRRRPGVNGNA